MAVPQPCPRCGEPVFVDDRFCAGCGQAVTVGTARSAQLTRATAAGPVAASACERCGKPVVFSGDRFCAQCGAQQPSEDSKQVRQWPSSGWEEIVERLRKATLGEYEILGELGRGGMAAVYLAHEIALNRKVAIKVMSPGFLLDPRMIERFRREAITAASLQHPNIVTIHSVGNAMQLHYFVMEYVEGRAADLVLQEHGPLPVAVVQALLFQAGNAMMYAHRRGVIHRDLKPANIMISVEGEAILMDFGIAKVAEASDSSQTTGHIGTPIYMSPEQCDSLPLTVASDQYSLGVVLYELLTGRPPFSGGALAILIGHTTTPPEPITARRGDVPAYLAEAVMRMLAKLPEDRWPDVAAAITACGAMPLGPGDPVRAQLIRLAAGPATSPRAWASTPLSPRPARTLARDPGLRAVNAVQIKSLDEPIRPGDAVQLKVRVAAKSGETLHGRVISWSSSNQQVAQVSADGLLQALTEGEVVITARSEGVSGSLPLAVLPPIPVRIEMQLPGGPLEVGGRQPSPVAPVPTPVRRGPLLLGLGGVAVAAAALSWFVLRDNKTAEPILVIPPPPPAQPAAASPLPPPGVVPPPTLPLPAGRQLGSVKIAPRSLELELGQAAVLRSELRDDAGTAFSDPIRRPAWRSEDPSVARVDARTGTVTPVGPGRTGVRVSMDGREDRIPVTVTLPAATSLAITPATESLTVGKTVQLGVTLLGRSGTVPLRGGIHWSSDNHRIAEVSEGGVVTAAGPGTATIAAEADGVRGSLQLRVPTLSPSPPPPPPPPPAAPPAPSGETLAPSAADLRREIGRLVDYISQKNLTELARIYPGTAADKTWQKFLGYVKDYDPKAVGPPSIQPGPVTGLQAMADFTVELKWLKDSGDRTQKVAEFTATLDRTDGSWKLRSIRLRQPFP